MKPQGKRSNSMGASTKRQGRAAGATAADQRAGQLGSQVAATKVCVCVSVKGGCHGTLNMEAHAMHALEHAVSWAGGSLPKQV